MALVLGGRPAGDDGDDVAGAEGGVGIVYEVVLGVCEPLFESLSARARAAREPIVAASTHLVDDLVPFLTADSDLDGLLHQACRHDDAVKLVGHAPGGLGHL